SPAPCTAASDACVIAYVDSAKIIWENPFLGTGIAIYDHRKGFPNQVIADTAYNADWQTTRDYLAANGSDIFFYEGRWQFDEWLTGDTTYVAASGDGEWISI